MPASKTSALRYYPIILLQLFVWLPCFLSIGHCQAKDTTTIKNPKIRLLPSFYYLPETRIAAGAVAYSLFNWKSDTSNRVSNTQHYFSYTQNKQILIENSWQVFTDKNLWIWRGNADFSLFPEYYFGIGNHESSPNKILYSSKRLLIKNQAMRNFSTHTFLGLSGHFENLSTIHVLPPYQSDNLSELQPYNVLGIGPSFVRDTRDFVVTTSRGSLLEGSFLYYWARGRPSFSILSLDYRHFFPINSNKTVFGIQAVFRQGVGIIPFRLLPVLGGADMLRGSYAGRFRDQMVMGIQAECRSTVYKRFGIAVFAGMGQMGQTIFNDEIKLKGSLGLGLRYRLRKNENVNLRIDFARGLNSNGLYIVLAEAF